MTESSPRTVRIFALGSPHGDDQVAWAVADRLSEDPFLQSITYKLATPWDLVELLVPDCSVIVLDACAGVDSPGSVLRIGENELASSPVSRQSTHGGSLLQAIEMAKALQRTIRELVVFGVVVESCEPGDALSESARRAVDEAVQQIRILLSEWLPNG